MCMQKTLYRNHTDAHCGKEVAARKFPPWSKCPINNYSQCYGPLPIPSSRLNARKAPGTRPYCNCQLLKKLLQIKQNCVNLIPWKVLLENLNDFHNFFLLDANFNYLKKLYSGTCLTDTPQQTPLNNAWPFPQMYRKGKRSHVIVNSPVTHSMPTGNLPEVMDISL